VQDGVAGLRRGSFQPSRMDRRLAVVDLARRINGHDDVLVDILEEARFSGGDIRSRPVAQLGLAYLPWCGTEKLLARHAGKSFHDRVHAKIGMARNVWAYFRRISCGVVETLLLA
jgi:hypothetical protein